MFERMVERASRLAEQRARERSAILAVRVQDALPHGVKAEARPEGLLLSGRGLRRRFLLEPALRWLTGTMR
jgi:hypothetical protein